MQRLAVACCYKSRDASCFAAVLSTRVSSPHPCFVRAAGPKTLFMPVGIYCGYVTMKFMVQRGAGVGSGRFKYYLGRQVLFFWWVLGTPAWPKNESPRQWKGILMGAAYAKGGVSVYVVGLVLEVTLW